LDARPERENAPAKKKKKKTKGIGIRGRRGGEHGVHRGNPAEKKVVLSQGGATVIGDKEQV